MHTIFVPPPFIVTSYITEAFLRSFSFTSNYVDYLFITVLFAKSPILLTVSELVCFWHVCLINE